jgi:hypothetical protein
LKKNIYFYGTDVRDVEIRHEFEDWTSIRDWTSIVSQRKNTICHKDIKTWTKLQLFFLYKTQNQQHFYHMLISLYTFTELYIVMLQKITKLVFKNLSPQHSSKYVRIRLTIDVQSLIDVQSSNSCLISTSRTSVP